MDFPITSDCAMAPDRLLLGDASQMLAIMRAHYGQPHTCGNTCDRYQRERLMTLRERLHETMHVGDPHNWRCYYSDDCPMLRQGGVVDTITKVFAEWLVEQAEAVRTESMESMAYNIAGSSAVLGLADQVRR